MNRKLTKHLHTEKLNNHKREYEKSLIDLRNLDFSFRQMGIKTPCIARFVLQKQNITPKLVLDIAMYRDWLETLLPE